MPLLTVPTHARSRSDRLKSHYLRPERNPIHLRSTFGLIICCSLCVAFLPRHTALGQVASPASSATGNLSFRPRDPLNLVAFDHFYNLDYDRAVQEFEQVLRRHPDDPFAINHLLTAVLFHELYRMGVLNAGEYANDTFIKAAHRPANPQAQAQIKDLVKRALTVEQNRLASNPNDVEALYTRGVTRAQLATYTALIEHAWFSALHSAVGARHDHERVLELAPGDSEAKLIVGTHNYVVGSLPWALRSASAMAGLGGNKEKGLQLLRECASGNGETAVDARILLALFLRREHRYDESLPIVRQLIAAYPRNILMALEEGNLLRAEGHLQEAAAVYNKGWQAGTRGGYPGSHYEVAALSLGELLRSQKDYVRAAAAYEMASAVPEPDADIGQKANLGAGEMYDLLQKRDLAVKKYELVIAADGNTPSADAARKYMKDPYRE
jgi:Tetratricopeptide repeat